jgi:hypothetical protein
MTLGEIKLKDGGDARAHIDKILSLHEELTCMGEAVSNKEYFNMVFMSLPNSYNLILTFMSMNMTIFPSKRIQSQS